MYICIFLEVVNCFLHKGMLGERNVPYLQIIYYSMHMSNTCIICNYIGNICNYMRKQWKPTAFQANMNQDFFPFPQLLYSINLSHRHKNITWIFKKIPDLSQNFLISYRISWADDTDDSESLLLPCIFFGPYKGGRQYIFEACSLYTTAAPVPSAMGSFFLKKPTHISFIPSSENS